VRESPSVRVGTFSVVSVSGRRLTVALYTITVFLYWMALNLYLPTLPTYIQSKANDLALVGTVLSMYGLWQAIIRLPLGITADWLGRRKPFIIIGLALAGLGAWSMGTTGSVNGLIVGRAITGLAAGTWVLLVVRFSSLFPPQEAVRASAALTLCGSIARILATSVTGSLNEWGGYSLAFFLAAGVAVLAILIVLPIGEQRGPLQRPSVESLGRLIIRRDVLLPALLAAVGQYADWGVTFGFMPVLAKQLGGTGVTQSILVTLSLVTFALGNLATSSVVNRVGARRLVYMSFGLISVGVGIAALAPSLWVLFVAQACLGLSLGVGYPVLMGLSIQNVADTERTTAMGLYQSVYAIGMFGGPWLSGIIAAAIGIQPMFGVTAFACLALGLFGARWLAEKKSDHLN
jgi:DHA1 family multidrug resistance protein-like MFS transporter